MLVAGLQTAPDGSSAKLVGIVGGHCGSLEEGEAAVRPLKAFGPPVMDALGPIPYSALNAMLDPAFPKGALNYWKAQFLTDLSDEAIRTLIAGFEACPSPMSHIIIEHFHGAASRVPVAARHARCASPASTSSSSRSGRIRSETERGIAWARDTFAALTPFLAPTRYVNYLEDDAVDPAAVAYGPNLPRLRAHQDEVRPGKLLPAERQHSAETAVIEAPRVAPPHRPFIRAAVVATVGPPARRSRRRSDPSPVPTPSGGT